MWLLKKQLNVPQKKFEIKSLKEPLIVSISSFEFFSLNFFFFSFLLAPPDRTGTIKKSNNIYCCKNIIFFFVEVTYEIKVKSNDSIMYADDNQGTVQLTVYGDLGSSGVIDLRTDENDTKRFDGQSTTIKKKAFDAGKVRILI